MFYEERIDKLCDAMAAKLLSIKGVVEVHVRREFQYVLYYIKYIDNSILPVSVMIELLKLDFEGTYSKLKECIEGEHHVSI